MAQLVKAGGFYPRTRRMLWHDNENTLISRPWNTRLYQQTTAFTEHSQFWRRPQVIARLLAKPHPRGESTREWRWRGGLADHRSGHQEDTMGKTREGGKEKSNVRGLCRGHTERWGRWEHTVAEPGLLATAEAITNGTRLAMNSSTVVLCLSWCYFRRAPCLLGLLTPVVSAPPYEK